MKQYIFQRIRNDDLNIDYPWMFLAESPNDILEHSNIYMNKEIEKGVINFFESKKEKKHFANRYAGCINNLMMINGSTFLIESTKLENNIFRGKLNALLKFGQIYLRENGSYMIAGDGYSIIEEKIIDKLIYPNDWTSKDIKITQWPGGKHYYATIGNVEVIGATGLQKWNTYKEADRNAKVALSNL